MSFYTSENIEADSSPQRMYFLSSICKYCKQQRKLKEIRNNICNYCEENI